MYVIDDNVLDEIRDRADIVDLIGGYVDLKRSGSNYMGLCPFHSEKTPSFSVSPSKGIFKCFGCGVGGDVITFIMKRENLGFREAVEFLADKYNIRLNEYKDENKEVREKRDRFYEINREAALYFWKNLNSSKKAKLYLKNRMLNEKTIRSYGIGYSKDSWTDLLDYLKSLGYEEEELFELNLVSKSKNGNYIDRFRDRIMFPIINRNNRVIGFGARGFFDAKPKYLNSKETPIFHKGNNLFNMNIISKESSRERIILVEGYMDVISLYNSGINYSVASLGTSLTADQAKIIKKMARDIYICYDSDDAGINATSRAIDIFLSISVKPKIIELDGGLDPDDFIKKYGVEGFENKIKGAISYIDFKIKRLKENFNLEENEGLSNFTIESAKIFSSIKNPIERDIFVKDFSKNYNISINAINNYINYLNRNKLKENRKDRFKVKKNTNVVQNTKTKAQEELLSYSLLDNDIYEYIKNKIEVYYFTNVNTRIVFEEIPRMFEEELDIREFLYDLIDKKLIEKDFVEIILDLIKKINVNYKIIDELISTLEKNYLQNEKNKILENIGKLQGEENKNLLLEALKDLKSINLKLNELKGEGNNER
ncbi:MULTISPECIES: DNA primase [Peptoniphilus]|uniref:DNA primase n=1 Tax=Peptoniphilus TaxID=162289 RepID=UPI000287A31E|nr:MULTISPECIES: DNA primase [Peptoniphilus]MBS6611023.1 DNA primase [Peptoniphilus harei]MDU1953992.1 DNA primase [Peptoniphilus lacydonensis]MDU2115230.1 DNA primase [Peptoniphilus lacydonensis]MDU5275145.1 DNA primase [Peptoniphilus lacydonensis]MDU5377976.1 DNA primase [Peptoniphilus lacydonensis]